MAGQSDLADVVTRDVDEFIDNLGIATAYGTRRIELINYAFKIGKDRGGG